MNDSKETTAPGPAPDLAFDPDQLGQGPYVDGFSRRTVLGALFVAFVMMPGSIYMGLVAGQSLGAAAEWVTIILFAEVARRSFVRLKRQEVFVLFYVASSIAAVTLAHLALSGGPFASAIWHQYLLQAPETSTISDQIPDWVVPPLDSPGIQRRNLASGGWWWSESAGFLSPVLLVAIGFVLGRVAFVTMGYLAFRATSDVERLPFPLAPIAAEGATALAESTVRDTDEGQRGGSWRWNVFSVGACLGIIFGAIYLLVPVVTSFFFSKPITILPIPFYDLTENVESILPASLISISFDAAIFMTGLVLPFKLILGTCTAILLTSVLGNPILLKLGAFEHWQPGSRLLVNEMLLRFDFWMSVTVGVAAAVLLIGIVSMVKAFWARRQELNAARQAEAGRSFPSDHDSSGNGGDGNAIHGDERRPSRERGDFPAWVAATLFFAATLCFCLICRLLVPDFPFWIVVLFGFIWTPLHSYISARLIGLTGTGLTTPFLKETAFILSGHQRIDIWFAPIPMADYGSVAMRFRELELTRTKFTSIIKAEILMFPIILISSFLFWWFFWHLYQIPSDAFPFASRLWPVAARQAYLIYTANLGDQPLLLEALKPAVILSSAGIGLFVYLVFGALGIPVVFFYGMVGGIGVPLHGGLALLVGALLGRYYFRRRFGEAKWTRYAPVVVAGFSCGMGLAGMTAVALALIARVPMELPF